VSGNPSPVQNYPSPNPSVMIVGNVGNVAAQHLVSSFNGGVHSPPTYGGSSPSQSPHSGLNNNNSNDFNVAMTSSSTPSSVYNSIFSHSSATYYNPHYSYGMMHSPSANSGGNSHEQSLISS
jgi:hypothetical protein